MALSFVCVLVAEVFANGEDDNPILNRGEYFEHHLHIIVVRYISNHKCDIEFFQTNIWVITLFVIIIITIHF